MPGFGQSLIVFWSSLFTSWFQSVTEGHNIESGTGCGFNDFANGDQQSEMPGLLALSSNNGSTETHAFPAGSVAEDAGDFAGCLADLNGYGVTTGILIADQRGEPRGLTICDVGAYELQPPP